MSKTFEYGHFITIVAKDMVVKQYGGQTKDWPPENFWATVSSYRDVIKQADLPELMKQYGITELTEVPTEALPDDQQNHV